MTAAAASGPGGRRRALLRWHAEQGRDLPWRKVTHPYPILVSEIMLQQTQAGRVIDSFESFLRRFPDAETLAKASLAEVVDEWRGLGYYRRARRLRDAARIVVETGWPTTAAGLRSLPGVGPYTAAAVACFAFGQQLAAVDTNARRVLSRWMGRPLANSSLRSAASEELAPGRARQWNEAIMDLGAAVCTARAPRCDACPVSRWCAGPDGYVPRRRPQPYEGSVRQARGAVVKALPGREATSVGDLVASTGLPADRIREAVRALEADAMVIERAGTVRLAT